MADSKQSDSNEVSAFSSQSLYLYFKCIKPIRGITELEIYVKIVINWRLGVNCSYAYHFCLFSALVFETVILKRRHEHFNNFSVDLY